MIKNFYDFLLYLIIENNNKINCILDFIEKEDLSNEDLKKYLSRVKRLESYCCFYINLLVKRGFKCKKH